MWNREPAVIIGAVASAVALLVAFGVNVTDEQAKAVIDYLEGFCETHKNELKCWIIDPTSSGIGSDTIDPYTGKEVVRNDE